MRQDLTNLGFIHVMVQHLALKYATLTGFAIAIAFAIVIAIKIAMGVAMDGIMIVIAWLGQGPIVASERV